MSTDNYVFTGPQLRQLLYGTIEMFLEYRDAHGKTEAEAPLHAVNEMSEGLDAELDLFASGEVPYLTLQSYPCTKEVPA